MTLSPESTVFLHRTSGGRYIANDTNGNHEVVYIPETLRRKLGATVTDEVKFLRSLAEQQKQPDPRAWTLGMAILMGFLMGLSGAVAIVWLVLAVGML